jgi:hypothetical protein
MVLVSGCQSYPRTQAELRPHGYALSDLSFVSPEGERRQVTNYELWWKEAKQDGRRYNFCLVPAGGQAGFTWRLMVFLEDKEVWTYDSLLRRTNLDCVTTPALRAGRVRWKVHYTYWH